MHAIEDGFIIMIYSSTHDTKMVNGFIHRKHAVRLFLNKGMRVMWHESLYHSGAKSRKVLVDLWKLTWDYLYIFGLLLQTVYETEMLVLLMVLSENMVNISIEINWINTCVKIFYDDPFECPQCIEWDTVIDCICVPNASFNQVGGTTVGDLKNMDG